MSDVHVRVLYFDLGRTLVDGDRWIDGALALLRSARERNLALGVISNTGGLTREDLGPFLPPDFDFGLFDAELVLLSGELPYQKPDPRIFAEAIRRSGFAAAECLFCTEELEHTLVAQHAGMRVARVRPSNAEDVSGLLEILERSGLIPAPPEVDGEAPALVRDAAGRVCGMEHATPVSPETLLGPSVQADTGLRAAAAAIAAAPAAAAGPTVRQVADAYVRRVSGSFGLAPGMAMALDAGVAAAPALRFRKEKEVAGTAVASYVQRHDELPVWGSYFTVRIRSDSLAVTSSSSHLQHDLEILPPVGDPSATLDDGDLPELLGVPADAGLTVNRKRLLIYPFAAADRLDTHEAETGDEAHEAPPDLPLPPLPESIVEGSFRVAHEVLFTLAVDKWGEVHWRAMVDTETPAVLYLRAFISAVDVEGLVFPQDPVTQSGQDLSGSSPAAALDNFRHPVALLGLGPADAAGVQSLKGEFVEMIDTDAPFTPAPAETTPFVFDYSAVTDDFAAVNAYYHCDRLYRMVQEMGISVFDYFDGTSFPIPVDHRGESGVRNAHAWGNNTGTGMGRYTFGRLQSGTPVGIATAWRVVLHEFGHALLWDNVDSPNFGFAHSAGDSLAAILNDPTSQAPDRFATFPFARLTTRRHDRAVADGWGWSGFQHNAGYNGEQILSTTLFRAYRAIGGDSDDLDEREFAARYMAYLVIAGVGLLSATTTDPRVYVTALQDADRNSLDLDGHPGGAVGKVLRWAFEKQGLFNGPPPVDVFLEDGRGGEYGHQDEYWNCTDVWNRTQPDAGEAHQNPVAGTASYLYVRVRNRGRQTATGLRVNAHQTSAIGDLTWPDDWQAIGGEVTSDEPLAAGDDRVLGPIRWTPRQAGREHVLARVGAVQDPDNTSRLRGPIRQRRLVLNDNNIGQRLMAPEEP